MNGSPVINEAVIVGGEWPADEVVGVPSGWMKWMLWVAPVAGSVTGHGGARASLGGV